MNKLRKIMYSIGLPFICIGLILIIVIMIISMINYNEKFSFEKIAIYVWLMLIAFGIGILVILSMLPFVLKSERQEYADKTSLDFTNIDKTHLPVFAPIIGFDEAVKFQSEGLYLIKLKKLLKYNHLKISVLHKEFYGQKNNFFKIEIDNKKYKDLPKFFYIDYLKEILYQFKEYGVEVSNLEELNKSKKDIQEDTSTVINKYHYSYKALILKGVISLAFIAGSVTIIILKDNNIFAYFLMMIAILVWTNGTKTGTLSLTEKGIILKKNFMRIEIPYEEVINIKLTEKNLVISSPFNFIEFEPIEEIALEVQKKVV